MGLPVTALLVSVCLCFASSISIPKNFFTFFVKCFFFLFVSFCVSGFEKRFFLFRRWPATIFKIYKQLIHFINYSLIQIFDFFFRVQSSSKKRFENWSTLIRCNFPNLIRTCLAIHSADFLKIFQNNLCFGCTLDGFFFLTKNERTEWKESSSRLTCTFDKFKNSGYKSSGKRCWKTKIAFGGWAVSSR